MAAGGLSPEVCADLVCSLCQGYFQAPVSVAECGHNFCRACLAGRWGASEGDPSCPECGAAAPPGTLRPNRHVATLVEIVKQLSPPEGRRGEAEEAGGGKGGLCEKHRQPLKVFCQADEVPICVLCVRSKAHERHAVVPLDEALQEYQDQFQTRLDILLKEKEKRSACKAGNEKEMRQLLEQIESERQKMVAEFRQMHQFLEDKEKVLLNQMEELEKEIAKERVKELMGLSSLECLIFEMEERIQQPANVLLQGVRSALKRCEEEFKEISESPVTLPLELKWKTQDICDINCSLKAVTKHFQDTLTSGLQLQKAYVTLDPDTAHPHLLLPEDCTSVREGEDAQDLLDNPERFDQLAAVLGREGFTSGRHFWDVTVGRDPGWAVGVARKSVRRKGTIEFSPEEGIWAVENWLGGYNAFVSPHYDPLTTSGDLRGIRVSLNYHAGRVAFYDVDTAAPLYIFSGASFSGETLFPFFWVHLKAQVDLSP